MIDIVVQKHISSEKKLIAPPERKRQLGWNLKYGADNGI